MQRRKRAERALTSRFYERLPFDPPDFELEFYNRKIVEVTGELVEFGEDSYVQVTGLHVMRGADLIPPAGEDN